MLFSPHARCQQIPNQSRSLCLWTRWKEVTLNCLTKKLPLVSILSLLWQGACSSEPAKRVTVEMERQQGGVKQADKLSLHFQKGSVDCSLNFFSEESLKYIEKLGAGPIPVEFDVSYSSSGEPSGAILVRVAAIDSQRLQPNERLLSTTQRLKLGTPGDVKTLRIESPSSCFDALKGGQHSTD